MEKIEVLIVDDSALMRKMVSEILSKHPLILPKDTAINGKVALNKVKKNTFDVILLDIEMPEMDGIQFLEEYSKLNLNIPIILLSSFARRGAEITMKALSLGAKDFITKPSGPISIDIEKVGNEIIEKVLIWGLKRENSSNKVEVSQTLGIKEAEKVKFENPPITEVISKKPINPKLIGIGVSTGGPSAIRKLISDIDKDFPGIIVVQHMPELFTAEFAKSLANSFPEFNIVEAKDYDLVLPGKIIIAKGGKHLEVHQKENKIFVRIVENDNFSFKPSADLLFSSIAKNIGKDAIGIIMTGMGSDGAEGLKELYDKGAITIAQGEKSCVIFGMPKSAILKKAVDFVWEIEEMGPNLKTLITLLK
ncbi:MAG: chemotaxis-specific protein-glutamate methyltransferase CheB [Brevinematia bacterium]